ncbi:hypothetical protein ES708_20581 [subsurface metagenome]
MESLSEKPLVMIMQTGKYWVSDYLSLFLWGVSTNAENNPFSLLSFSRWRGRR